MQEELILLSVACRAVPAEAAERRISWHNVRWKAIKAFQGGFYFRMAPAAELPGGVYLCVHHVTGRITTTFCIMSVWKPEQCMLCS